MSDSTALITEDNSDRLIRGSLLKFIDGVWSTRDGEPIPEQLLVMSVTKGLQRWAESRPVETIMQKAGEPLPDVEALNEAIPVEEWELGLNGKRPPWQLNSVCYLIDPQTGSNFTFSNSTTGARIACEKLRERLETMRRFRGANCTAVVKLGSRVMRTQFGQKRRPEFEIERWFSFGEEAAPAQIEHKPSLKEVAPPTLSEEMGDEIPSWVTEQGPAF
jgi:hypothetical protein